MKKVIHNGLKQHENMLPVHNVKYIVHPQPIDSIKNRKPSSNFLAYFTKTFLRAQPLHIYLLFSYQTKTQFHGRKQRNINRVWSGLFELDFYPSGIILTVFITSMYLMRQLLHLRSTF